MAYALINRALTTQLNSFLSGSAVEVRPVRNAIQQIYEKAGYFFLQDTYGQLSGIAQKDTGLREAWLRRMVSELATAIREKAERITQTTIAIVKRVAGRARDLFRKRALIIAETEIVAAGNLGAMVAADHYQQQTGKGVNKTWITVLDVRTRPAHKAVNGQTLPVNKPFLVWGANMQMPGDPAGGVKNIAHCRCALRFSVA